MHGHGYIGVKGWDMSGYSYASLQALIIDDFESCRLTLSKMLQIIGVGRIDSASSSDEGLALCRKHAYDLILCDQHLGKGKTGLQIVEWLRHQPSRNSDSLFVLVSADSNKHVIMSASDYEPDAYIVKPISTQVLAQRLERLFKQRQVLLPITRAIKQQDHAQVVALCLSEIDSQSRHANRCQKLLARYFLQRGEARNAEAIYRRVLESRALDWAMLGMAEVKKMQGDMLSAQQWLEEILQCNPLCLSALDGLADIMSERSDFKERQIYLARAVDISPLSLTRQQALADIAFKNNDLWVATSAYKKAITLGEHSCHDDIKFHKDFLRASIKFAEVNIEMARPMVRDALQVATNLPELFGKGAEVKLASLFLESQLHAVCNERSKSLDAMHKAEKIMANQKLPLELHLECVNALRKQDRVREADHHIQTLLREYRGQEEALQEIDTLLTEPRTQKNIALVDKCNKDGIAFYDTHQFGRAAESFMQAANNFPHQVGLQLNLLQALIAQYKQSDTSPRIVHHMQLSVKRTQQLMTADHPQYHRFLQLQTIMHSLLADKLVS
jgi:DNA-binding NarL/FixJ family response regulator